MNIQVSFKELPEPWSDCTGEMSRRTSGNLAYCLFARRSFALAGRKAATKFREPLSDMGKRAAPLG